MNNKFLKFQDTALYQQFASVLDIELELITISEYNYYKDTLTFLRDTFKCENIPTSTQINTYINDNENINESCIDDFKTLIDRIFYKYYKINKLLLKMNKKQIQKEQDNIEREKRTIEKKQIFEEEKKIRREEREKQLKKKEEQDRLLRIERDNQRKLKQDAKDEKRKQLYEYNNAILTCICGNQYIRYTKLNHQSSSSHMDRLDAINWYKNNSSVVFDNDSVISDNSSLDSSNLDIYLDIY